MINDILTTKGPCYTTSAAVYIESMYIHYMIILLDLFLSLIFIISS